MSEEEIQEEVLKQIPDAIDTAQKFISAYSKVDGELLSTEEFLTAIDVLNSGDLDASAV